MTRSRFVWSLLTVVTTSDWLHAQARVADHSVEESCRKFVQDFYDWYVPMVLVDDPHRFSDTALKDRKYAFGHELFRLLKEDSEAQDKNPGDIVGLDFDPFVGNQDPGGPGDRYVVRGIRGTGDRCRVEVYYAPKSRDRPVLNREDEKPDVVPELTVRNGRWLFVNFHYPRLGNGDLSSTLKALRAARKRVK